MIFVSTCDVENAVVSGKGAVLPALTFPVDHDLHDLCPHREGCGVEGQAGRGAITCLKVLAWNKFKVKVKRRKKSV